MKLIKIIIPITILIKIRIIFGMTQQEINTDSTEQIPTSSEIDLLLEEVRNEKIKNAKSIALEILSSVGLQGREHHKPHELSGGECQRVAVARALVTSPNIILADEPTGNLDPDTAETVFERFINLNRSLNSSLVMVTHNHQLAETMDRVFELKHGKLIEIR